jgi:hypothetical protein
MTIQTFPAATPPLSGDAERFAAHERSRVLAAALHARRVYPGRVGELLQRELTAYAEFGYRFDADALIPRLAAEILALPTPRLDEAC